MLDPHKKLIRFLSVITVTFGMTTMSHAGTCSPGIPCTGYDIYNQTDAGTSGSYNGAKSGGTAISGGNYTTTACDGNFMNQIYARAFMEAQREVLMSEQIIHKPDSVLEYTCFDQYIGLAAEHLDEIFSAHQGWNEKEIELASEEDDTDPDEVTINDSDTSYYDDQDDFSVFANDRYDNLLEDLLLENLEDYIDNNFDHTFMGESITLDNDLDTGGITPDYECAHMSAIWEIAKCVDFGEDDRFRSFEHLVEYDPRSIPQACPQSDTVSTPTTQIFSDSSGQGSSISEGDDDTKLDERSSGDELTIGVNIPSESITTPQFSLNTGGILTTMPSEGLDDKCPDAAAPNTNVNTDFSNDLLRVANNCDAQSSTSGTAGEPNTNIYSSFDLMESYRNLTKGFALIGIPGAGSDTGSIICTDTQPIPTGVPVITYTHSFTNTPSDFDSVQRNMFIHYDHICPNPGCYYQPVKLPYIQGTPIPDESTFSSGECLPGF